MKLGSIAFATVVAHIAAFPVHADRKLEVAPNRVSINTSAKSTGLPHRTYESVLARILRSETYDKLSERLSTDHQFESARLISWRTGPRNNLAEYEFTYAGKWTDERCVLTAQQNLNKLEEPALFSSLQCD